MKPANPLFRLLASVSDFTDHLGFPAPAHPLLTVIDLAQHRHPPVTGPALRQLYIVALKKNLKGRIQYGHRAYDFNEGVLAFYAPGQLCENNESIDVSELSGWMLVFHPDLLHKYPLGRKIAGYGFFSYQVHEALHLSEREEQMLDSVLDVLRREHAQPIDGFSQDVLVAQLDVLLSYANRFYHRQFLTRRPAEHDLLTRFEELLREYFAEDKEQPLPTVQHFADALHVSPAYLSDMLRTLTGQNTQQHIHQTLIEKAKQLLLSTSLSVNETAYQLGFEYPQYFTRLFKSKTGFTPAAFRLSVQ
ncbi:helix-turn-helix transcriptional regulator [Microvirga sp. STR05]|uniref:Helix-turn-helix transcriptional regulator n=1 Tax=Hymenobacter duratus TaxID=2771356 RepID=A0ABR8JIC9_9BACT|nr:helix-turn-helix transcriptional regulator [Hymenobacter duratus]MBD2716617.1 helix-turn-helix transcriptional regulator [Hymenobacter duratus]MBR7951532.1 helix-turn-helix transcriptional regulator [Microvirga sp. STR05]